MQLFTKYCLDTSGISTPLNDHPEDIFESLWRIIIEKINSGLFCWNVEIGEELELIDGPVGEALRKSGNHCCLEIGDNKWPWRNYLETIESWRIDYRDYISEYNSKRRNTISLNDLSIVALGKTLSLPVISMEKSNQGQSSTKKLRIPDL